MIAQVKWVSLLHLAGDTPRRWGLSGEGAAFGDVATAGTRQDKQAVVGQLAFSAGRAGVALTEVSLAVCGLVALPPPVGTPCLRHGPVHLLPPAAVTFVK